MLVYVFYVCVFACTVVLSLSLSYCALWVSLVVLFRFNSDWLRFFAIVAYPVILFLNMSIKTNKNNILITIKNLRLFFVLFATFDEQSALIIIILK